MMFRRRKEQAQPICGCGHHLSMHDRATGLCHHTTALYNEGRDIVDNGYRQPARNPWGTIKTVPARTLAKTVQCGCRQYVGPEQIQLYTAAPTYLPPVAGDKT